jgi:hypothetical protein
MYIYDCILTLSIEMQFYRQRRNRHQLISLISLRYGSLLYQMVVIFGVTWFDFTLRVRLASGPVQRLTEFLQRFARTIFAADRTDANQLLGLGQSRLEHRHILSGRVCRYVEAY